MESRRRFRQGSARAAAALTLLLAVPCGQAAQFVDVPYVPTPPVVVAAMLELAGVGPRDYVADLGSGDGRIVIAAARQFGARGFGVEIDDALVREARREARRQGVADRVEFKAENLFSIEIGRATVVTLYLYGGLLLKLRPRLITELKPGSRVVSHDFDMADWRPDAHVTVPVPDKPYGPPSSEIYLWIVPENAAGDWRWRTVVEGAAVEYELALSQTFQMLDGQARVAGGAGRFESGSVRGERVQFALTADVRGRALRHEFSGRVDGDTITGIVSIAGAGERDWKATRVRRGSITVTTATSDR